MKNHLFKILKQETDHTDKRIWSIIKKYYEENNINISNQRELLIGYSKLVLKDNYEAFKQMEEQRIDEYLVNYNYNNGKHHRQITEKELKFAAKELKLKYGLITHIINKVRNMQSKSGNCH